MKNKNGITLVALIITIIVMVILAGIIITAAVADGGIIDRAEEAMKKNERAEAEELVIASYVYKTTASMTTVGTLDLEATADAIYENLTSNGFTLMDGNVEAGSGSDILEGDKIILNIIGKHCNYTGTVTEKGLKEDIKIIDEKSNPWIERGLNASVQYDTKYFNNIFMGGNLVYFECILYSNGGAYMMGDETSNEEIDLAIENGYIKVSNNTIEYDDLKFIIGDDGKQIEIFESGISIGYLYTEKQEGQITNDFEMQVQQYSNESPVISVALLIKAPIIENVTSSNKILKIREDEGEWRDVTSEVDYWLQDQGYENIVFEISANGMYEIKLELGEKTSTKRVEINKIEVETYTTEEVLEKLGITNNTGTYKGTWTVISKNDNEIKLVSTDSIGKIEIGYEDPKAKVAVPAIDENSLTDIEKTKRARWSYVNARETLKNEVERATGITSARSVSLQDIYDLIGEENVDKGYSDGEIYNYYFDSSTSTVYSKSKKANSNDWSTPYNIGSSEQTFINENGEEVIIDSENDEITLTYDYYEYSLNDEQKQKIGGLLYRSCWLDTYRLETNRFGCNYDVRYWTGSKISTSGVLFSSGSPGLSGSVNNDVRAIVIIPADK